MTRKFFSIIIFIIGFLFFNQVQIYSETIISIGNDGLNGSENLLSVGVMDYLLYVGTYTPNGTGISIYSMNTKTGLLKYLGISPNVSNPSFIAIHPNKKWLFTVGENNDGTLSSFKIKDSLTLEFINTIPSTGQGPCYLSIDNSGKYLLTSHYNSGSVTSVPINPDGSLGKAVSIISNSATSINKERQSAPHAHSIIPYFSNNLIYSADLGADLIYCYKIDTTSGKLSSISKTSITAGSGPRHIAFHPIKNWVYELNELSRTVECFLIDSDSGELTYLNTFPIVNDNGDGALAADIHITPSGSYLYASVRDPENIIAVFSINEQNGSLTLIEKIPSGGKTPRNFAIDPSGRFLLVGNQNSNDIIIFSIDQKSGKLNQVGDAVAVPSPVCIKFMD